MGITFTVYSEGQNIDRAWPFDIIPRTMPAKEWKNTEAGLKQRLRALNCFIDDVYHKRDIVRSRRFSKGGAGEFKELSQGLYGRKAGARRLGACLRQRFDP